MDSFVSSARQSAAVEIGACTPQAPSRPRFQVNGESEHPRAYPDATRIEGALVQAVSFGSFCLLPAQLLLLHESAPVPLGSRAMEILIALVERAGELVGKEELMARVWPNTFVAPANLTVQLSGLRRALGDGRDGNRFVVNSPGRGYRFVAPVTFARTHLERCLSRTPR